MSQVSERAGVSHSVDVLVRYHEAPQLSFASLIEEIRNLRALVVVADLTYPQAPVQRNTTPGESSPGRTPGTRDTGSEVPKRLIDLSDRTRTIERTTRVRSLNYNSPLDVVLTLLGTGTSALVLANHILAVRDRYQASRRFKSEVDRTIAANEAITEAIRRARGRSALVDNDLSSVIDQAARALVHIEQLVIEPRPDNGD